MYRRLLQLLWCVSCCVATVSQSSIAEQTEQLQRPSGLAEPKTVRSPERVYGGLSVSRWHNRIKSIDPKAPVAGAVVGPLIEIVADERLPGVDREPIAAFLARVGDSARDVVPVLATMIERRDDSSDYLWAARALALMGEPARDATPQLVDMVLDERIPVEMRQSPIEALALIGPSHPDAIPALLRLLQYRESSRTTAKDAAMMRRLAAESIFLLGPNAEVAAPLLVRMIRNRDEGEAARRNAIVALGAMKGGGMIAVNALSEELISGQSPALRDAAARAIVDIGGDSLRVATRLLSHPDAGIRWRLACSLGTVEGAAAIPLRPHLTTGMRDPDSMVSICAAESHWRLYGVAAEVAPVAIELLVDRDRNVRIRAKNLLLAMKPLDESHLAMLKNRQANATGFAKASLTATLKQLAK